MDKNINEVLYGCVGIVVLGVVLIIAGTLLSGWALSVMWAWYVVPVFELPVLGIKNAILLATLIGYFTPTELYKDAENKTENQKILNGIAAILFKPIFYVAWFWVIINWF